MKDREIIRIQQELQGRSLLLLRDFEKIFPAIPYEDKWGPYSNWDIWIWANEAAGYRIEMIAGPRVYSYQDFWNRWYRFQNLKAFL